MRTEDPVTSTLWTLLFQRHTEAGDVFLHTRKAQAFFDKLLGLVLDGATDLALLQAKFHPNLLAAAADCS